MVEMFLARGLFGEVLGWVSWKLNRGVSADSLPLLSAERGAGARGR